MMTLADNRCILAIDPTPRGLAFVSFEDGAVQDWGTRMARDMEEALKALDALIDRCAPEVLVIEDATADGCLRRARMRALLRKIDDAGRKRGLEVLPISREAVNVACLTRGLRNKYAIAQAIGTGFEELEPLVPAPRKHYDIEPGGIHMFDAAALALYAFGVVGDQVAA
jgi:hypothetical protein